MTDLVRLSLSIEQSLYDRLEEMVSEAGYSNRSEFVRDMIRNRIVEKKWEIGAEVIGTITLVFDHSTRNLSKKLTKVQHSHFGEILASTHVHISRKMCAEMILVRGTPDRIRHISDTLRQQKGVLHGELCMSAIGEELS